MGDIRLLDCTLRDGGYVNDWEFGHNNLISVYERLVSAGVEIIEVGFIDERRPFDSERSIFPNTESVEKIWGSVRKKAPMTVGMIDYGTCSLENIQDCKDSFLDGIRVIFKKHIMHEAMAYCAELKKKGYKVFSQLVSITSYSDDELMELVELVNEVEPYAVSMVDTYGLLTPDSLLHYYELLDKNVKKNIQIGFHAHNNLELAYANDYAFVSKKTERDIVVDATLYGMGKSAGNSQIELVTNHLNQVFGKKYEIAPLLECIEESIMPFFEKSPWGYKMFFYLCAKNRCHPNYVSYFLEKDNLSVTNLDQLLSRIEPEDKKLLYDGKVAEAIYQDYLKNETNDELAIGQLKDSMKEKEVLLIGPGKTAALQKEKINEYINNNHPIVVAINYIPEDIPVDYVFATKNSRYQQMTDALHENQNIRIIATTNITAVSGEFDYVINRAPLLEEKEYVKDNSFLMLLNVLQQVGVRKVSCAGLDGYSSKEENYANPHMEYEFVKHEAEYLNRHIRTMLSGKYANMQVSFITYSHYSQEDSIMSARI